MTQQHLPFNPDTQGFIRRFEWWITRQCRQVTQLPNTPPDPTELIAQARPWVDELRLLCFAGALRCMSPLDACTLACLFAFILCRIEHHYRQLGLNPADVTLALYPIDDLLVGLSLVEYGLIPHGEGRDAYQSAPEQHTHTGVTA